MAHNKKKVLVMIADGSEEIETVTVIDILRRANANVLVASQAEGVVTCSRGTRLVAETTLKMIADEEFDLIYMPGGIPGAHNLGSDPDAKKIIQKANKESKYVAAICAAPIELGRMGILSDKDFTCHPAETCNIVDGNYIESRVISSGKLITSKSAGTSMELAFKLVEILYGKEMVAEVNKGVYANI